MVKDFARHVEILQEHTQLSTNTSSFVDMTMPMIQFFDNLLGTSTGANPTILQGKFISNQDKFVEHLVASEHHRALQFVFFCKMMLACKYSSCEYFSYWTRRMPICLYHYPLISRYISHSLIIDRLLLRPRAGRVYDQAIMEAGLRRSKRDGASSGLFSWHDCMSARPQSFQQRKAKETYETSENIYQQILPILGRKRSYQLPPYVIAT